MLTGLGTVIPEEWELLKLSVPTSSELACQVLLLP